MIQLTLPVGKIPTMRRRTLLLGAATVLAGCSSARPAPRSTANPKTLLAAARANLNATTGVHIDMVGADIPKDISAVLTARGNGAPTPAWQGRIKLQTKGVEVFIPIIAIKGDVWATLPWNDHMTKIDPAHYKSPNPAMYFDKDKGLSSLLAVVRDPAIGDSQRSGDTILQTVTGTVPAGEIHRVLGVGATTGSYDLTFGIDDTDRLITLRIEGPLFKDTTCRYDVTFSKYGQRVDIRPPQIG